MNGNCMGIICLTLHAAHVLTPKWKPTALPPHTLHGGRICDSLVLLRFGVVFLA